MEKIIFENVADFDPEHIFECGQCFRWVPAGDGSGDYIGAASSYAARLSWSGSAGIQAPDGQARSTIAGSRSENGLVSMEVSGGDEAFWRRYFDLDTDYSSVKKTLISNDPDIEAAVDYGHGIRILNQDLFETIISFIISQNNNIPRIRKNIESICDKYGETIGEAYGREWHAFPAPEKLAAADIDDLTGLKLGYRASYIKETARAFAEGRCPSCREDVLAFHGVGPKVANCIMLFGLHDTAAFPIDTWVRHIMNDMYGFDESDLKGMQSFAAEKFGEYAGYAQQYLFYYYRDRRA